MIQVAWGEPQPESGDALARVADFSPQCHTQMTVAAIIVEVALKHGISVEDLRGCRREIRYSHPRQEAMYRAYTETEASFPMIGRMFKRDHTTIMHAVGAYEIRNGLPQTVLKTKRQFAAMRRKKARADWVEMVAAEIKARTPISSLSTNCAAR